MAVKIGRAAAWLSRLGETVASVIYPAGLSCLSCGSHVRGELLCDSCRAELDALSASQVQTADVNARAVWQHKGAPRHLVHTLKHEGMPDAAQILAERISALIQPGELPDDTVVTWVTMPASRLKTRGIDHGRMLAELTAQRLNLPARRLLDRVDEAAGSTQQGMNRAERLQHLQGKFSALPLQGQTVLLVDDVFTTGATARVCTQELISAGATGVIVLTATAATDSAEERPDTGREESGDV